MDKHEIIQSGLLEEYVLGIISPRERDMVEALIEQDQEVAAMVEEMKGAMRHYCKSIVKTPPLDAKSKMINRINKLAESQVKQINSGQHVSIWRRLGPWSAAASILFFGKSIG